MQNLNIFETAMASITKWAASAGLQLLFAVLVLVVGWWLSKLLIKALRNILLKSRVDPAASGFICSVVRVLLWMIVIITAVGQLNININSMIAALGAAGLTASFALQGSLGNFVSGMQVIFSKPFGIGDFLAVDVHMGTVKAITVLNTTLVTPDNKEIIIPNSVLTTGVVVNYTAQKTRRLDLIYPLSYKADTEKALEILQDMAERDPLILKDPAPIIAVDAYLPNGIQVVARVWVAADQYWDIYYRMQKEVKQAFDENGISFPVPFPQSDLLKK